MASGDSPTGACYTTGLTWGTGPRLSVYLWPELPDAGADADADGGDAGDASADGGRGRDAGAPPRRRRDAGR
jgi:hypothetical protein